MQEVRYIISLTSVPPRYERLHPILQALVAQVPKPDAVYLCLPARYDRFGLAPAPPDVPEGVEVLRTDMDLGPGLKAIGPVARHPKTRLIYCDDDWEMRPGWAAALLAAQKGAEAVTGQGFRISRLKRQSQAGPGYADIAQGFSGVLVNTDWLEGARVPEDRALAMVDDIWLSAHLAQAGIGIRVAPGARRLIRPAFQDAQALQDQSIGGISRAEANRGCAAWAARAFGIWPEML